MKKTFSDFFPVPKFLEMRPMGLAISERCVHAIELVQKSNGLEVGRFGLREIPEGTIKEGYVNDKKALTDVLRSLQKELAIEFVNVSLPDEKAYLFKTDFPKSGTADLRQAVEFRLEENAPISANEAVFDYMIIPNENNSGHIDVSVSVLPSKMVDTYLEIIKSAGLKPAMLSVEASAVSRSVVPKNDNRTFLIVDVGETSTSLSIVNRGVVQFNTTISIGGDTLTSAIAKHFSVDIAEAKKIKLEKGYLKNQENMQLFFSLMNTVSAIKDEVNKLFVYWQTHRTPPSGTDDKKIEKILLCGKDTNLAGFDEYLSSSVKVPVEVADVWQNAFSHDDFTPPISYLDSLDYAGAIGLALPEDK